MKYTFLILLVFILALYSCVQNTPNNIDNHHHFKLTPEQQKHLNRLMKQMTLDEKIGQLSLISTNWELTGTTKYDNFVELIKQGKVGNVFNAFGVKNTRMLQELVMEHTRLKIPLLFGYDVIHGYRTIFPQNIGEACSFDLDLMERTARISSEEAAAAGLHWTFAPMVDVAREPRWGRMSEGVGEDTWYASQIARIKVIGIQGNDLSANNTLLACVKHFAAYGAPQAGRDYHTVDISLRTLYNDYLPPYKAAIDAGCVSVMTSFNEIAGVPSTSNKWLLTNLLREQWNFQGFVVTDFSSINELIPHGVAKDEKHAGELSLNAGVDMDMQGFIYSNHLDELLKESKITKQQIDDACERILRLKFKLGLFENPYKYSDPKREEQTILKPEFIELAKEAAQKSIVLLKNDYNTLPLKKNIKNIAIIGPLANAKADLLGNWKGRGKAQDVITLAEGIKNKLPQANIYIEKGMKKVNDMNTDSFAKAINVAQKADLVILCLGEEAKMSGEGGSRTNIDLPGVQNELAKAIIKIGKPTVCLLYNGRPLAISKLDNIANTIVECWFPGIQAGNAIASILFGDYNPSGKLVATFPRNVGQIPIHYNMKNTGRPIESTKNRDRYKSRYIDSPNTPLYPFGYGLSYTSFEYSNLQLDKTTMTQDQSLAITVEVANTGNYDGEEVAQLYIQDMVGSVTRPVRELRGFQKVFLKKGETKTVSFTLTNEDLKFYNIDMNYVSEPGEFNVYVGGDSKAKLQQTFVLQ